jgi:hypothetical protein
MLIRNVLIVLSLVVCSLQSKGAQTGGSIDPCVVATYQSGGGVGADSCGSLPGSGGGVQALGAANFFKKGSSIVRFGIVENGMVVAWEQGTAEISNNHHQFAKIPGNYAPFVDEYLAVGWAKLIGSTQGTPAETSQTTLKTGWWCCGKWIRVDCPPKDGESTNAHAGRFWADVMAKEAILVPDNPQPPPSPPPSRFEPYQFPRCAYCEAELTYAAIDSRLRCKNCGANVSAHALMQMTPRGSDFGYQPFLRKISGAIVLEPTKVRK